MFVSNDRHIGTNVPDHLGSRHVHWEDCDSSQPECNATAHEQGPGQSPDIHEASPVTEPRDTYNKKYQRTQSGMNYRLGGARQCQETCRNGKDKYSTDFS